MVKRIFVGLLMLFVLAAMAACSNSLSKEERRAEFQAFYGEVSASQEQREAEFSALFNELYSETADDRYESFNKWYAENEQTRGEKLAEFMEFYASISEERRQDFRDMLLSELFGGERQEGLSLTLGMAGVSAFKEATRNVRMISLELTVKETVERTMELAGVSTPEELPDFITVLGNGEVLIPGWALGFEDLPMAGFLHGDYVATDGSLYASLCRDASEEARGKNIFKFTLLPNSDEAQWKKEILAEMSGTELCASNEAYPRYYPHSKTLVFQRPQNRVLPEAENMPIRVASAGDLEPGGLLVFPTITAVGPLANYGILMGVKKFEGTKLTELSLMGIPAIAPTQFDVGAPVYYISTDLTNPIKLVGFITDPYNIPAIAMSAEYYLSGMEEFPYEDY